MSGASQEVAGGSATRGSGCGTAMSQERPQLAGYAPGRGPNPQTVCSSWWAPTSRWGGRGLRSTPGGRRGVRVLEVRLTNFIPSCTASRDPICSQTRLPWAPTPSQTQSRALSAQIPPSSLTSGLERFENPSHSVLLPHHPLQSRLAPHFTCGGLGVFPSAWGHSLLRPNPALWFSLWSCQQPPSACTHPQGGEGPKLCSLFSKHKATFPPSSQPYPPTPSPWQLGGTSRAVLRTGTAGMEEGCLGPFSLALSPNPYLCPNHCRRSSGHYNFPLTGVSRLPLSPCNNCFSTQQPEKAFQNINQILPFPAYNPPKAPTGPWITALLTCLCSLGLRGVARPCSSYSSSQEACPRLTTTASLACVQILQSGSRVWPRGLEPGSLSCCGECSSCPFNWLLQSPLLGASHTPVPSHSVIYVHSSVNSSLK